MGHKNWYVPDQLDATLITISLKRKPLLAEKKLIELLCFDLLSKILFSSFERRRLSSNKCRLPLGPGHTALIVLQRAKQSIIVQPGNIAMAKIGKRELKFRI